MKQKNPSLSIIGGLKTSNAVLTENFNPISFRGSNKPNKTLANFDQ